MTPKVLVLADLTPPYDQPTSLEKDVIMMREPGVLTTKNLIKRVLRDPLIRGLICPLGQKIDATVFRELPQLEVVSNVAVGLDNIDLESAKRKKLRCRIPPLF
jgi:glyoxylate reductase